MINQAKIFKQFPELKKLNFWWNYVQNIVPSRGLAAYASNVSFGHPEHRFFDSLDIQKFM